MAGVSILTWLVERASNFPEHFYHVLDRGDRRECIFRDDADRNGFSQPWAKPVDAPAGGEGTFDFLHKHLRWPKRAR